MSEGTSPSPSIPDAPPSSTTTQKGITELNANDVLCGRGPGLAYYDGNLRFRELCEERRQQYISTNKRRVKRMIAQEVLDIVHSNGGRFLKQQESAYGGHCLDSDCVWYETDEDVALEKCKQSLRENREPSSSSPKKKNNVSHDASESGNAALMESIPESIPSQAGAEQTQIPLAPASTFSSSAIPEDTTSTNDVDLLVDPSPVSSTPAPFASPPDESTSTGPSVLDPRLLLFQNTASFAPQEQATLTPAALMNHLLHSRPGTESTVPPNAEMSQQELLLQSLVHSANVAAAASHQRYMAENAMYALVQNFALLQTAQASTATSQQSPPEAQNSGAECLASSKDNMETDEEDVERRLSEFSIDEELSAFLLSSLAVSDRPVVTEEQEAAELAAMTDEEKASLLADTFGKMACENYDAPRKKRARVDLDKGFIDFLVRQMRIEIDKIPMHEKMALSEAMQFAACHSEEFGDKRLEKFLRVEGMDVRLAAERFVRYWENRRQVFGPDKFLMRMKLSQALKDDSVALNTCVYTILPYQDVSGRTILFMQPRCHTREGYTSESLLRAFWYVAEVAAQENNSNGIVNIVWFKDATIWDYDRVFDRWAQLMSSCWPIKLIANHLVRCPTMILRIVRPIVHSFVSKEFRARTLSHNAGTERDILQVLWSYGLQEEMLPTQMGGTLVLDQEEWIANRRAAELEEIM